MQIKQVDWYGFDHKAVAKKFEGNPQFVNYFPFEDKKGTQWVGAVYYVAKPNKKKGHKNYMILFKQDEKFFVTGMTKREINKFRHVDAILCKKCDTLLYSLSGHHFNMCDCVNQAFIDGGLNYTRYGALKLADVQGVKLDLLTGLTWKSVSEI